MNQRIRKPTAFRLDDPAIVVTPAVEPHRAAPAVKVSQSGEQKSFDPPAAATAPARGGAPWATMFWVSAGGLPRRAPGPRPPHLNPGPLRPARSARRPPLGPVARAPRP